MPVVCPLQPRVALTRLFALEDGDNGSCGWLVEDNVLEDVYHWMFVWDGRPGKMVDMRWASNWVDSKLFTDNALDNNVTVGNNTLVLGGRWPAAARAVMAAAGARPKAQWSGAGAGSPLQPRQQAPFSWDTPPVYIHCALPNGLSQPQAAFMATRPLVTIEKFICQKCGVACGTTCVNDSHAEAKLVAAAEQIHAHNASTRILAYFPGWLAHPWYDLTAAVNATVEHGFVTTDAATRAGADGAWIFNWSNPVVRGMYIEAVLRVLKSPAVAGVFIDGTPQDLMYCEHAPRGGPRTCFNSTAAWNSTGDGPSVRLSFLRLCSERWH